MKLVRRVLSSTRFSRDSRESFQSRNVLSKKLRMCVRCYSNGTRRVTLHTYAEHVMAAQQVTCQHYSVVAILPAVPTGIRSEHFVIDPSVCFTCLSSVLLCTLAAPTSSPWCDLLVNLSEPCVNDDASLDLCHLGASSVLQ